jgi:hypothetical protein
MTAAGYDEAVQQGEPYSAIPDVLAEDSPVPVAITEADPLTEEELRLQELPRDLRADTVTPAPDLLSTGTAAIEEIEELMPEEDLDSESAVVAVQSETAPELQDGEAATQTGAETTKQEDASEDNAAK